MALEATSNQNSFEGPSEISGYFRHFGFKRDPFGVEEKEASFYLLPNWEQQIDLMLHYIRHENVLLTLTGPKGIGKTTLINFFLLEAIHGFSPTETAVQSDLVSGEFLVQSGDTIRTCQVMADNALNPEQMLEAMAGAFDISTEHFFGSFEHQSDILLDNLQHNKQSCVLLIDEAHELPDATLELLLYMISQQSENQHRFHVVLIGESDLKKRLAKINKNKDYTGLTYSVELEPLNLSQTEYYLKHRFAAAGFTDEMLFSTGMINKIYKLSGGIPKVINQLARQSLFEILKKKKFSSLGAIFKPYKKTFVGGGFLLMSFAIILLYLGQDVKLKSQHPKTAYPQIVMQKKTLFPANLPAVSYSAESSQKTSAGIAKEQLQAQPLSKQIERPIAPSMPLGQKSPASHQAVAITNKSIVEASSLIEPGSAKMAENVGVKAPLLVSPQKLIIKDPVKMHLKTLQSEERVQNSVTPEHKATENIYAKKIPGCSEEHPKLGDTASREIHEQHGKCSTKAHLEKQGVYAKQLMKKDPAHYTLKFKDMASESASKAFIARYKAGNNAAYYLAKVNGVNKYVIVYGEYANLETAQRAISFLPNTLQHLEPKPYRIGLIQETIRNAAR